jgi:disulfide bond formation protein DsbB
MIVIQKYVQKFGLYAAWIVAVVATLGSLYLSEVMLYEPCKLCWIQRIFMYPLAIMLGIACLCGKHETGGDKAVIRYSLPLSIIGGLIALYHYLIQQVPDMRGLSTCSAGIPCHLDYLDWFGWITIPLLALIAFILITVILFITKERSDLR